MGEETARVICPFCKKPLESILATTLLVKNVAAPGIDSPMDVFEKSPADPIGVYACPHCKSFLSVSGGSNSYIGKINIRT